LESALCDAGILFRENYGEDDRSGYSLIFSLKRDPYIGFVFFHAKETESCSITGKVRLTYGTFDDEKHTTKEIGHTICRVARENGFRVEWNGDTKIKIALLRLKKRYFGHLHGVDDVDSTDEETDEL
jgi:hypothetical protein